MWRAPTQLPVGLTEQIQLRCVGSTHQLHPLSWKERLLVAIGAAAGRLFIIVVLCILLMNNEK
jgi:hypothetical protein